MTVELPDMYDKSVVAINVTDDPNSGALGLRFPQEIGTFRDADALYLQDDTIPLPTEPRSVSLPSVSFALKPTVPPPNVVELVSAC